MAGTKVLKGERGFGTALGETMSLAPAKILSKKLGVGRGAEGHCSGRLKN